MSDLSSLFEGMDKSKLVGKKVRLQNSKAHTVTVGHILSYDPNSDCIDVEVEESISSQPVSPIQATNLVADSHSPSTGISSRVAPSDDLFDAFFAHEAATAAETSGSLKPLPDSTATPSALVSNSPTAGPPLTTTPSALVNSSPAAGPSLTAPPPAPDDLFFGFSSTSPTAGNHQNGTFDPFEAFASTATTTASAATTSQQAWEAFDAQSPAPAATSTTAPASLPASALDPATTPGTQQAAGPLGSWEAFGQAPSFSLPDNLAAGGSGDGEAAARLGRQKGGVRASSFAGFTPVQAGSERQGLDAVDSRTWDAFDAVGAGTPDAVPPPRPQQGATPASAQDHPAARARRASGDSTTTDPFTELASDSKPAVPDQHRPSRHSDPGSAPAFLLPLPTPAGRPPLAPGASTSHTSSGSTSRTPSASAAAPPAAAAATPFAAVAARTPSASTAAPPAGAAATPFAGAASRTPSASAAAAPNGATEVSTSRAVSRTLSEVAGLTLLAEPTAAYGQQEDGFLIVNGVASATFELDGRNTTKGWPSRGMLRKGGWWGGGRRAAKQLDAPVAAAAKAPKKQRKAWLSETTQVILSSIIGNTLEWYDFLIYVYLNPIITALFFPHDNAVALQLAYWGIFAAGFLARPLGALVFGHIGDRFSRKTALLLSIWLMSLPTALIGCLPTYDMVGMAAPVLLCLARILQGLALGGEFTGTIVFLVEHAKPGRRGITGSWAFFSVSTGILLGSAVSLVLLMTFSKEQLLSWAWRLPFLGALVGSVLGGYMRHTIRDPLEFEQSRQREAARRSEEGVLKVVRVEEPQAAPPAAAANNGNYTRTARGSKAGDEDLETEDVSLVGADALGAAHQDLDLDGVKEAPVTVVAADLHAQHTPLRRVFTRHFGRLLLVLLIDFMTSCGFYIVVIYLPVYLTTVLGYGHRDVQAITTVNTVVLAIAVPVGGLLSDRFGRQALLVLPAITMTVLSYPLFLLMSVRELGAAWFAQFLLVVMVGLFSGSLPATLVEVFPLEARFTGISFAHNLSMAVFGGTAPLVATAMVAVTGDKASPAAIIIVASFLSSCAVVGLRVLNIH